ncbi:hypothetical protein BDF19DRAFT_451932 [Syncephalis fuscata]|nr:hypothetical protein BDF19DRAFT_451932 [Syncephalis fuscata]
MAMSDIMTPINQTIYGHSAQHGYSTRLGVDANEINGDYEDLDLESDIKDPPILPLSPFASRGSAGGSNSGAEDTEDSYLPLVLPRQTASPTNSNSLTKFEIYKSRSRNNSHASSINDDTFPTDIHDHPKTGSTGNLPLHQKSYSGSNTRISDTLSSPRQHQSESSSRYNNGTASLLNTASKSSQSQQPSRYGQEQYTSSSKRSHIRDGQSSE